MKIFYQYTILTFVFALFLSTSGLFAQEKIDVDSYKIAYITERLNLTSAQAEKFWPIYNKHNKKYIELKKTVWEPIKKELNNIDNLSEKEAEILLEKYRDYRQMRLEYREAYITELLTVVTPKKIMQLKKADYDFNRELLKQMKSE
jgi:hypothetical protein